MTPDSLQGTTLTRQSTSTLAGVHGHGHSTQAQASQAHARPQQRAHQVHRGGGNGQGEKSSLASNHHGIGVNPGAVIGTDSLLPLGIIAGVNVPDVVWIIFF